MENLPDIIHRIASQKKTDVSVEVTITNRCNCNCEYCFESNHDDISSPLEEQRQIELLKKYCNDFDLSKHNSLTITFWGGEPMMNTKFLFNIIKETYKYGFVKYMMYSNGLLKDKFVDLIKQDFFDNIKNRLNIQLSYDGEPHHKIKRHTDSRIIMDVADLLSSVGINFSFKATLSMDSFNLLPQIWDSYEQLHKKYPFVRYCPTIDQENKNDTDENFEIWKKVIDTIAKKEKKFIKENGYPLWQWFSNSGKLACNMNNSISMHCDGKFYVCHGCHFLKNKDKFVCGDTLNNNIEEVLNNGFNPHKRELECIKCPAVACQICHVSELDKNIELMDDITNNWTKVMPKSEKRCKYFKYFGFIYRVLNMILINERIV